MEQEITTRAKAQQLGLKHYFTGEMCVRGHIDRRFTSIGKCMACAREDAMSKHTHTTTARRSYNNQISFVNAATLKHESKYTYAKAEYKNAHIKVVITCPEHGDFSMSPTNHIQGKGCNECANIKNGEEQRKNPNVFIADAIKIHGDAFDYTETVYTHAKAQIAIRCNKHPEKLLYQQASNHLSGQNPCSKCGTATSKAEQEIKEFMEQYAVVENPNKILLAPYDIDMWLPEYNMGIEYHGLYYHTTNKRGKLHRTKWEMAQKAGIRLVQIFEDEWINKQEIVKNRLLSFIGHGTKYNARQTILHPIMWGKAKEFLNATHIQGAGPVGSAYGLFIKDELIAVATFGKKRSGAMTGAREEGKYEVLRYASTGNVRGGFSKLYKTFLNEVNPTEVTSYCDLRYGTGKLYESTGFTLHSITEPDYWWVPNGRIERVPRYAVQKHKMAKPDHILHKYYALEKTENQICGEAGWEKIHGVGNQKWVWTP